MSQNINQLNRIALANTFAVIDIVLHPFFHIWGWISPQSYEYLMNLFVVGLNLKVTDFDTSFEHIIFGTIIEVIVFWLLGFVGATIYNHFNK